MKNLLKIIVIMLLIACVASLTVGCKKEIKSGEDYYLYVFDTSSDRFVRTTTSLKFGEGFKTFEYTFIEGLTVSGTVEHSEKPDSYTISCNEEAVALVTARYKENLEKSGADENEIALYEALAEGFTPQAQYFVYEGNLFMGDAVEMYHEPGGDSDSFEGIYRIDDQSDKIRLRGGNMYGVDDDGEYTVKKGYYSVSRGILTLTSTNEDGSDRYENGVLYRQRYLMAKITLPEEEKLIGTTLEEQVKSSPFISKINSEISEYYGQTISVLVEQFFAKEI